jgi:hypothetical protein
LKRGTKTCENTTEKLKTAGAGLKDKGKGKGQNDEGKGKGAEEGKHSEKARGRRRGSHAGGSSSSDDADGNGGEEDGTEEEGEEEAAALDRERERERERRQHQQRKQRERQKQAQEARQRAAELAELKEYREVLKEELASLWAAMGRCRPTPPPTPLPPVAMEGQLEGAWREALRLRRENDALVAELRDLDALILQAEAEGVHVFARPPPPPASGSGGGGAVAVAVAGRGGGSRKGEGEQPRRRPPAPAAAQERVVGRRPPVGPTLEEMIATECEARLAALGAARKAPGKKPLAAAAADVVPKPTREVHPAPPPSLYSPYLQLLTERGLRKKKQPPPQQRAASPCCHHHHHHHHTCQSPVPSPLATPTHHLPSPSSGGSAKAPVFPREAVRRDGKTVYVRESKPIEDWIGSLRASGGSGPPTPTPPLTAPSSLSAPHQQYRSRGGVGSGGGLSPVPSPSPGGLRVPRR